eukprot:9148220-Alexandrium_andersonii.AAC.1
MHFAGCGGYGHTECHRVTLPAARHTECAGSRIIAPPVIRSPPLNNPIATAQTGSPSCLGGMGRG